MAERGKRGGGGGEPPVESSSSRTQRMPMLVEPSSSLDVSVFVDDPTDATQPTMARPALIVLEEKPVGLADALSQLGLLVRATHTGMETLAVCGERAPQAVVVGPGDAERRRVLTSALRARFPDVGIVYVLTAPDPATREAAKADGVRAVLSWPLPPTPLVMNALRPAPQRSPVPAITRVAPTAAIPAMSSVPELSADLSETGSIPRPRPSSLSAIPLPAERLQKPAVAVAAPPPEATLSVARDATPRGRRKTASAASEQPLDLATLQVARLELPATRDSAYERTSPQHRPPTGAAAISAEGGPVASAGNVEDTDDLQQVATLLWQLDHAARFLEDLDAHVRGADHHAQVIRRAAELLAKKR